MKNKLIIISILLVLTCSPKIWGQIANPLADSAINAFNKVFLMKQSGQTTYRDHIISTKPDATWTLSLDILAMQDVYERTGSEEHKNLLKELGKGFLYFNPPPYSWDGWNDDLAWMGLGLSRGFLITKDSNLLKGAEHSFNLAYDRGWNTFFNDGGIWETQPDMTGSDGTISKEALSNNPNGNLACFLYEATGKADYLNKAIKIYNWSRSHIFNPTNGQVYTGIDRANMLNKGASVYNHGSFIDFAVELYRLTGNEQMLRDAQLAANFTIANLTNNGIISREEEYFDAWGDTYARGLGHLCVYNPQFWNTYYPFLKKNAEAIWANRRTDLNLTWNAWSQPTPSTNLKVTKFIGAVALMQYVPTLQPIPGIIQAEDYNYMKGIITENIINGKCISSIDSTDWVEYLVNIPSTGIYTISLKVSAVNVGSAFIQLNNNTLDTINIPATGDLQTYTTVKIPVQLIAGIQSVKLVAKIGGWKIDQWEAQSCQSITPSISINDAAEQQVTTATLNIGDKILFNPLPTDGSWSWTGPNNFSSNERQIVLNNIQLNQGGLYIAKYINPAGFVSMQEFMVTLNGCTADSIVPNFKINDGALQQVSSVKAAAGSFITIAPTPMDGSWSWTGPNGFTSKTREISFLSTTYKQAGNYTVTYINAGGCKSTKIVNIALTGSDPNGSPIVFYANVNNVGWSQQPISYSLLSNGGSVQLGPHPNDPVGWKWTGPNNFVSTSRAITISSFNALKVGHYTATYTNPAGGVSSGDFVIGMKGCSTTSIVPDILVNGVAWANANAVSIASGGNISITPPDIDGTWSWSGPNGFTSNSRQISFNNILTWKEGRYVLSLIDANSCISTYTLDVTVIGNDYCGTTIVPYINVTGAWQNVATASLKSGASITFGPQPNKDKGWRWTGPKGFTASTRAFTLNALTVAQAGTYSATYTNSSGCESYMDFKVTVDGINAINSIEDEKSELQLYPNPVTDIVTLKGVPSNTTISISDLSGRVLLQMKSSNESDNTSINISNLKAGIYFVKVNTVDSKLLKLIKQ